MAHAVTSARTLTATVVAVCPADRLGETRKALGALQARSAVRSLVVTLGEEPQPATAEEDGTIVIERLTPRFLNNVVAARRVSSLPAMAWWRGGDRDVLDDLAPLVDRLVMDSTEPVDDWRAALHLVDVSAVADLRWTRLTRWRTLLSQFFDVPAVRDTAADFTRLEIAAADRPAAQLFAGWLAASLPSGRRLETKIQPGDPPHPVSAVTLSSGAHRLELRAMPNGTCVRSTLDTGASRIGSLGDQSLAALLEQELRIRARDTMFEQALRFAAEAR